MSHNQALTQANLRTPKAAAIAGMVFSLLTIVVFGLLWISVPDDPPSPARMFDHGHRAGL
jgi:hypothetical protein